MSNGDAERVVEGMGDRCGRPREIDWVGEVARALALQLIYFLAAVCLSHAILSG